MRSLFMHRSPGCFKTAAAHREAVSRRAKLWQRLELLPLRCTFRCGVIRGLTHSGVAGCGRNEDYRGRSARRCCRCFRPGERRAASPKASAAPVAESGLALDMNMRDRP